MYIIGYESIGGVLYAIWYNDATDTCRNLPA